MEKSSKVKQRGLEESKSDAYADSEYESSYDKTYKLPTKNRHRSKQSKTSGDVRK